MLPGLTAFMISSSCGIRVLPKNCISSAPFDCAVTSFAIQSKATAADSGIALIWAKTSFFGWACAKAGARPVARMPARPVPARSSVRRLSKTRLAGADIGRPPKLAFCCGSGAPVGRKLTGSWARCQWDVKRFSCGRSSLRRPHHCDQFFPVMFELLVADPGHTAELVQCRRARTRDAIDGRVVQYDIGWNAAPARHVGTPCPKCCDQRRVAGAALAGR